MQKQRKIVFFAVSHCILKNSTNFVLSKLSFEFKLLLSIQVISIFCYDNNYLSIFHRIEEDYRTQILCLSVLAPSANTKCNANVITHFSVQKRLRVFATKQTISTRSCRYLQCIRQHFNQLQQMIKFFYRNFSAINKFPKHEIVLCIGRYFFNIMLWHRYNTMYFLIYFVLTRNIYLYGEEKNSIFNSKLYVVTQKSVKKVRSNSATEKAQTIDDEYTSEYLRITKMLSLNIIYIKIQAVFHVGSFLSLFCFHGFNGRFVLCIRLGVSSCIILTNDNRAMNGKL